MLKHQSTMDDILYNAIFMLVLSKKIEEDCFDLGSNLPVKSTH